MAAPPLLIPFFLQVLLATAAFIAAPHLARQSKPVWATAGAGALAAMFLWPLMRLFPVEPIALFGAPLIACVELTGLAIPAVLFFGIAARRMPKKSDARALLMLTIIAGVYFVKAGWWMVSPGVPDLGTTRMQGDVCRQTTGYTCVAASMVTMLRAHGINAEETEMARLSHTQVDGGATDSRTLWALQERLTGTSLRPVYQRLDVAGLLKVPKPCMVQLDWGYFISHMVPVMDATPERIVIGDPLSGLREMSTAEFASKWKRTAISLAPNHRAPSP